ncbi:hypothetical protein CEXT_327121 [Caerostris extrusa]|uniref:Secreted protein n=1 Tax=Caerostris extrusa TaxID=172846 RepID=A0AAV4Y533_CAEEX|nr:hypothetical protein CEXT_327121 [Caerostris extrusa]
MLHSKLFLSLLMCHYVKPNRYRIPTQYIQLSVAIRQARNTFSIVLQWVSERGKRSVQVIEIPQTITWDAKRTTMLMALCNLCNALCGMCVPCFLIDARDKAT